MILKRTLLVLLAFLSALNISARPGHRGLMTIRQKDGREIRVQMQGDEWCHVLTAETGEALKQDAEGFWCYAYYTADGTLLSTGVRAGSSILSPELLSRCRDIPYQTLRERSGKYLVPLEVSRGEGRERTRRTVAARRTKATPAQRHGLIILAQFNDLTFKAAHNRSRFEELINGDAPTSALSYFRDQWGDVYDFRFDISDPVTLPNGYAYYGRNGSDGRDEHPEQLLVDACYAADGSIDFSAYDNDGDGTVDNVFVIFAGPDEAENAGDDFLWSHQWYLYRGARVSLALDGVRIDNYACSAELTYNTAQRDYSNLCGIGTFCHEYTHTFGIPDLYDTVHPLDGSQSEALWRSLDLMDAGNQNNHGQTPPNYSAIERWIFGLQAPKTLSAGPHTLPPVNQDGDYYLLPTDNEGEFFLLECRLATGWDEYIGGSGLLIYHIDRSLNDAGDGLTARERWVQNKVNGNPDHQCIDLVEPDSQARTAFKQAHSSTAVLNLVPRAIWPYGDLNTFSRDTDPAFRYWSGEEVSFALTDIRRSADGSVSFQVTPNPEERAPSVQVDDQRVFQDAAILQWSSTVPGYTGPSYVRYAPADESRMEEIEVQPYEPGRYAVILEKLLPMTPYKVQLFCKSGGVSGPVNNYAAFTTRSASKDGQLPYIYLKDIGRNGDGSFPGGTRIPLRVYHATEAEGVKWLFNGASARPGPDGYFLLPGSGTLKAVVFYPDGTSGVLEKKISVR